MEHISRSFSVDGEIDKKSELYEYLAELYVDNATPELAISVLKEGIKETQDKEQFHYRLAIHYDRMKMFEESIASMKQVIKINPNNANALNFVGYLYADHNQSLDEALALIEKALVLKPDDGFITDSLGWVYFKRGDLEKAFKYLLKAQELVPDEPTIAEHLGDLYQAKGDQAKALNYYKKSLKLLKALQDASSTESDPQRIEEKIHGLGETKDLSFPAP